MVQSKGRLVAILVGALCIVVGATSIAFANDLPVEFGQGWFGGKAGRALKIAEGMGFMKRADTTKLSLGENPRLVLAYIAGNTGTPLETLLEEYKGGKTLEEIAETYGVDWAEIQEAIPCPGCTAALDTDRLERAIERTTDNIGKLTERMEMFESRIPEYEAKISEIEDETLRDFAQRHLDLMERRWELGDDHLSIMKERAELLEDELDYAKSR